MVGLRCIQRLDPAKRGVDSLPGLSVVDPGEASWPPGRAGRDSGAAPRQAWFPKWRRVTKGSGNEELVAGRAGPRGPGAPRCRIRGRLRPQGWVRSQRGHRCPASPRPGPRLAGRRYRSGHGDVRGGRGAAVPSGRCGRRFGGHDRSAPLAHRPPWARKRHRRGRRLSYVHDGEPADVVFTRNTLHQVPDFWKGIALERIASFLRPHGMLRLRDLVFDFAPHEAAERIEAWMSAAVSDPAAGWTAEELAEHVRTEFSTYSWLRTRCSTAPGSTSSSARSVAPPTALTPAGGAGPDGARSHRRCGGRMRG